MVTYGKVEPVHVLNRSGLLYYLQHALAYDETQREEKRETK
jgi:hypothetical protein